MKARGQYSYIGNLIVDFDIAGNVVGWESTRNEPIATTEEAITVMAERLNETTNGPIDEVACLFNTLTTSSPLIRTGFEIIGETRFPPNHWLYDDFISMEINLNRLMGDRCLPLVGKGASWNYFRGRGWR